MGKLIFENQFYSMNLLYLRSDLRTRIWGNDKNVENARTHVIIREKGHYFGNCIAFDHPGMSPVGMDNKVNGMTQYFVLFTNNTYNAPC